MLLNAGELNSSGKDVYMSICLSSFKNNDSQEAQGRVCVDHPVCWLSRYFFNYPFHQRHVVAGWK